MSLISAMIWSLVMACSWIGRLRRCRAVGGVDVAQDFGDGDESFDGNFLVEIERPQDFREIRILAHADAMLKGEIEDLLGEGAASGSNDLGSGQGAFQIGRASCRERGCKYG